jgi:TolB-like protein/Tfp pilus assembly protein PilF
MKRCPQCNRVETDEALKFCRVDGTTLISDSGPVSREGGTAQLGSPPDTSEVHTSILPHQTNPGINRATGPTTTLPAPTVGATDQLPKSGKRKWLTIAGAAVLVLVVGIAGYWAFERYNAAAKNKVIDSIAVLPFENKSNTTDSDYLSDGLADSVIYRLSQLPNLKVSPTSSVMRYKGKQTEMTKIARELGVDAVMTGRLAQIGDNLQISVQLVDARTEKLLWAEQYDRKMSDLLATQREIASTIAEKLQLKLGGNEKGLTKKYTDSNEAYQLYLRGRYSFAKRTKDEMLHAIEYYQQAVKLDPKFALAYARISETYGSLPAYPYLSPKEAFPQAKAAAQRALEIDPTLAEAHTFLAYSLIIYDWNWQDGERSFKRAIELDPNSSTAHFRYGQVYLGPTGRLDECIAEMKRGLEGEPLDINMGATMAWAYLAEGQKDKALEQARKAYDLEPNHPIGRWIMCETYAENGMYDQAIAIAEQWLQTDPTNQFALRDAGVAYAKAGRREKAEEMIRRFREIARTQYVPACRLAAIYVALGEKDKAYEEFDQAFEARDWELFRIKTDPYWTSLQDDPRFKNLLQRVGLPE